jgi:hypothetical protein
MNMTAKVLLRCFLLGLALLLLWFVMVWLFGDFVYRVHSYFFDITWGQFETIHYAGMMALKLVIFTFFLLPYIAIRLVLRKMSEDAALGIHAGGLETYMDALKEEEASKIAELEAKLTVADETEKPIIEDQIAQTREEYLQKKKDAWRSLF